MKFILSIILVLLPFSNSFAENGPVNGNISVYCEKSGSSSQGKMALATAPANKNLDKELLEIRTLLLETQKMVATEKAGAYGAALNELKYWIMPSAYILLFFVVAILLMFGWLKEKEIVSLKKRTEDDLKDFKEQIKLSVRIELENNLVTLKDKIHTIVDNSMITHVKNIEGLKEDITQAVDDVVQRRLSDYSFISNQSNITPTSSEINIVEEVIDASQTAADNAQDEDPFSGDI